MTCVSISFFAELLRKRKLLRLICKSPFIMKQITIAISEPDRLFLQGITALLSEEKKFRIVVAECAAARFLKLLPLAQPQVALLDLHSPGPSGLQALQHIRKASPQTAVVIWSKQPQAHHIAQCLRLGAQSFLDKACALEELSHALRQVAAGGIFENSLVSQALNSEKHRAFFDQQKTCLSPREEEVLRMLCRQKTNREIARQLELSARTVEGHRKNLLTKTGARNLAGLVLFAVREGLVSC